MKRLELRLPERLVDRFWAHSRTTERTRNDVARDALDFYLQIAELVKNKNGSILITVDHGLAYFIVHPKTNL